MERNHRRLLLMICLLTVSAVCLAVKPLTVEDIYGGASLQGRSLRQLQWSSDGKRLVYFDPSAESDQGAFMSVDPLTARSRVLVSLATLQGKFSTLAALAANRGDSADEFSQFHLAPEENRLLFIYKGDIYEYALSGGRLLRWTYTQPAEDAVGYSPNGEIISFVREHNMFLLDTTTGTELQLTTDGHGNLTYGTTDWVLEEELGLTRGYWWSPDSRYLVILCLDESQVPEYPLVDWDNRHATPEFQKYPKAGDPNPVPRLYLYDTIKGEVGRLPVGGKDHHYLARVQWAPNSKHIVIQTLDRPQQNLRLLLLSTETSDIKVILTETDPAWVNVHDLLYLFKDRDELIWGSEREGYMHLFRYKFDGTLVGRLTQGDFSVTAFQHTDEWQEIIYFTCNRDNAFERHLYSLDLKKNTLQRLTSRPGTHKVHISPRGEYYVDEFTTAVTPPDYLTGTLTDIAGGQSFFGTDAAVYAGYDFSSFEYVTIPADDGTNLPARLLKPPAFDPAHRYPVLIYVYGGPHAQVLARDWSATYFLWHQLMAQQGFVVFSLDNRGAGGYGKKWEQSIRHRLGEMELADQMAGVRYLRSLPWVDSSRIGIWGWSYGGTMTCLALFRQPGVFAAGAAVAPVTDWRNYDTIYTERYMGQPHENPTGYQECSPLTHAGGLADPFLLIHGVADDNVHFQNAVQLTDALIRANKPFDLMIYPRQQHGIRERQSRIHLFNRLTDFFKTHLQPGK
ncbi:MAG: S9 family peptidase [Acidobacteria bacterium]|nr:S9 family peptidase [Acidobacteriota bacterium]